MRGKEGEVSAAFGVGVRIGTVVIAALCAVLMSFHKTGVGMTRSRYRFAEPGRPHFLTRTVVEWLPVFTCQEVVQIVFDTWIHQQREAGLRLYGFVLLENHLHAIAQAPDLPQTWARFKSFSARGVIEWLVARRAEPLLRSMMVGFKDEGCRREHRFWQEGSHPQTMDNEEMLRQKLDYIHQNPVRRGYVDAPEEWRWSSARCYLGREGLVEVFKAW